MHLFQTYDLQGVDGIDYIISDNGSPMVKVFCRLADDIAAGDEEVSEMDEGVHIIKLILCHYYFHVIEEVAL